jgi:superfamily II DNA or RNA helicase
VPTCKLIIKDEVNVKFEGLDLEMRKTLTNKFKYDIPYARYLPAYKLGRWDGKVSFFGLGGTTYVSMLEEALPLLEQKGWYVEVEDLRDPTQLNFSNITENYWKDQGVVWPKGHVAEGQPIVLRDYQVEVINNFLGNPQSLQEVATGAGKTIITATLSHLCEPYGRSLVIVPNKSLVVQTEEDYVNVGLDVGVYFGDRKELGHTHTICTWQSLNILSKKTKNHEAVTTFQEAMEDVKCIIVDEVHQAKADVLKQLLTQNFAHVPIRWGLTGTIPKEQFEFQGIKAGLGEVINHISAHDLQQKGVLANCHVNIVQTDDVQEFGNYQEELKYLVTSEHRIDWMAKLVDKIKESGNTLILVDRISAGKMLEERLEGSVFVSGETKGTDRKEHYDSIKDSTNKIIIATYGVAAVGINIPRIFNLVLIEPGKSFVRVIQSIGRGIRKAEDKDFVQIWDLTSRCKFAKRHLTQRKKYYKEANYPFTIEKIAID